MQEIFNEGRVVGLSAYEVYVRHHMEEYGDDPDNPPASERAWLASSITMGTSLLIQISPNGTYTQQKTWDAGEGAEGKYWGIEIKVPTRSRLCAANQILGNIFLGDAVLDTDNRPFCKSVTDYGFLSSDTHKHNYMNLVMNPDKITYYDNQLKEYSKLIDGVVIQPCQEPDGWDDYVPSLHDSPKIRLLFREKVEDTFYLLLTGFSDCSVINGTSIHTHGSKVTKRPDTGDFLGPEVFPWSTKILIQVPGAAISRLFADKFARRLLESGTSSYSGVKGGQSPYKVKGDSVVDFNHAHMSPFHDSGSSILRTPTARLKENVTRFTPLSDSINQLAVISRDGGKYDAPSLFGKEVTEVGEQFLYPIDVAAPGTVKAYPESGMSSGDAELKEFFKNRPGCYAMIARSDCTLYRVRQKADGGVERIPVADQWDGTIGLSGGITGKVGKYVKHQTGDKVQHFTRVPSVSDRIARVEDDAIVQSNIAKAGTGDYVSGVAADRMECLSGDIATNFVSLRTISYAYDVNNRLDLLGTALRKFRNNLKQKKDPSGNTVEDSLECYVKIDFKQPIVFNQTVTFNAPITVNSTADFNKDVTFKKNVEIGGHLRLKKHQYRNTDRTSCGNPDSVEAEAHIDMVGTAGSPGDVNRFGIGIGPSGAGYITLANGKRLYISNNEPVGGHIPIGSIGIGW